jgi:hypothetical protein
MPTTKAIAYSIVSMALGVGAFYKTQSVTVPIFEPIMEACQNLEIAPEDFAAKTGYHRYDPTLGFGVLNVFVCLATQFFHQLTQHAPAGTLALLTTVIVGLPMGVSITLEAGRKDAKGLVRYPIIMAFLYQIFGLSVIFPFLWVPSYILGRGEGGLSTARIYVSIPMVVPGVVLSILILWLDADSDLWTTCAAILGGPTICCINCFMWPIRDPDPNDKVLAQKSAEASTLPYAVAGLMSLAGWLWLVFIVTIPHYGFHPMAIYKDVWGEANPSVAFMMIDAVIVWMGMIVFIAYQKPQAGLEAIALSIMFGPGAGPALILAGLQMDDEFQMKLAIAAQKQRKAEALKKKKE